MVWIKLFKPTWGRLAVFLILFAIIALLDQYFLFFTVSPMTYNVFGPAAAHFIMFLLIIPYIISCIVPAFFIREWRHAKVHEFVESHKKKPKIERIEGAVDVIDDYEEIQERYAKSLKSRIKKPKTKKSQTKKAKTVKRKRKDRKTKSKTKHRR
jgi:hypothetical protein